MSYLKEFLKQISNRNFHQFLVLWEEYCTNDTINADEFAKLLKALKASEMGVQFGPITESAFSLWQKIDNEEDSYEILRLLVDLQTTNTPALAETTLQALQRVHGNHPKFNDWLRLIGLRSKDNFQGAISRFELLAHLKKGNIVFHIGGWGTGEIMDVSFVREHLLVEFENVSGKKDISFANAFKVLIPLPSTHFLARRFSDADNLEKEGKENPLDLITMLLRDLGPKTASEIKDELCELVIPENDWTKWWQSARGKIKKDPMIESPESIKDCFQLRTSELTSADKLKKVISGKGREQDLVQNTYNFVRDNVSALKDPQTKETLENRLLDYLKTELPEDHILQAHLLLDQFFGNKESGEFVANFIKSHAKIEKVVQQLEILAFKKRALVEIKENRKDWVAIYLNLLLTLSQVQLRDYLLKELNQNESKKALEDELKMLLNHPNRYPEAFVWYFNKLVEEKDEDIPYHGQEGRHYFFEAFLMLMSIIENNPTYKELVKKMYNILSGKRYALFRHLLQGTTLDQVKEYLLLISKCQSFSNHDLQILRSLTEVVHPSVGGAKKQKVADEEESVIWTTEEGFRKIQERVKTIGTVEMIENAREIEAARALGDLRENSEFKFAQEKRARLQSELKSLSEQLKHARLITPADVPSSEVGIGSTIDVESQNKEALNFCILGPWDANPEENVLSFNSKLAQEMIGKKKGETFNFKDEIYTIKKLGSFFK